MTFSARSKRCRKMEILKSKPSYSEDDLETILVSKEQIEHRIDSLADEISKTYAGQDLTVVCVLSGALVFTADLIRKLDLPTRLDCIRADSYGNALESTQPPRIASSLKTDISGKNVLIVDDILDTGRTLSAIIRHLEQARPASLRSCILLDKKERRRTDIEADFSGFDIPNAFVVGYGLDFAEHYRHLPCIGSLKREFQTIP